MATVEQLENQIKLALKTSQISRQWPGALPVNYHDKLDLANRIKEGLIKIGLNIYNIPVDLFGAKTKQEFIEAIKQNSSKNF